MYALERPCYAYIGTEQGTADPCSVPMYTQHGRSNAYIGAEQGTADLLLI